MWEYIIVGIVVLSAAGLLIYKLFATMNGKNKSTCASCPNRGTCKSRNPDNGSAVRKDS